MHYLTFPIVIGVLVLFSKLAAASVPVAVGEGLKGVIGYSDGKLHGSLAPLYECVFDRADIQPQYIQVPLKRGLGYLHSGEVSMVLPLAQSERRDRIGEFAGELFSADYVFVSNRQLPPISETSGLKYGLPRSFVGEQFITDENPRIEER
jgi:polar amino acid transport system substrate-binding protein